MTAITKKMHSSLTRCVFLVSRELVIGRHETNLFSALAVARLLFNDFSVSCERSLRYSCIKCVN